MKRVITIFCLLFLSLSANADDISFKGKAVLVTGASSGLGRAIAEKLASNGVYVYAGARRQKDIDALTAIENMQGIRLDVTKQNEIDAAVEAIKKEGRGLYGLVNNAGVFVYGPLIEMSEQDMQFVMDVNVFGPYRVTKAFAPLIIESKGRITSTGSISGVMTSGAMFGAYAMSKHAIEAYTDSLAAEMAKFDVQVSVIDPGNFKSNIMQNMHARLEKMQNNGEVTLFKDEYQRLAKFTKADRSTQKEPIPVADAAVHALFSEKPKRRYMVVPNQAEADMTLRSMFRRIEMLNKDHEFSKSTADLIKELETALAQ